MEIVEAARGRNNGGLPAVLRWIDDEEPPLARGDQFYLTAFHQLSTCRSVGLGPAAIPWRDIAAFGAQYLEQEMQHDFIQIVLALDAAYLKWARAKIPPPKGR